MKNFESKLDMLVNKLLSEEIEKKSMRMAEQASDDWMEIGVDEELHGDQHKLDVASPKGKITADDFKKLRNKGKKEIEEFYFDMNIDDYESDSDETEDDENYKWDVGNRSPKMIGSFDKTNWYDEDDYEANSDSFDDYDEEEFDDFDSFIGKHGGNQKWFSERSGKNIFNKYKKDFGGPFTVRSKRKTDMEEQETEEGNAFTGALAAAKKQGKDEFEVDGKKYNVKESRKRKLRLTEDELIDMIYDIVKEQKVDKSNIQVKQPEGLSKTNDVLSKNKKENEDATKETSKKMSDYISKGSKGKYDPQSKEFPKGNGEIEKMSKKAYSASDAVEEYIENFAYPGLENLSYDEIKPNEEWVSDNLEGSSRTGNNPEWANAVKTDLGKKMNEKRKKNLYQKEKQRSYNRVAQPIDEAGEGEGEKTLDKMFAKLESTENKTTKNINEEISKMKNIISYNRKTQ
jgi:hypothetical protein